jgi:hypothetical protein
MHHGVAGVVGVLWQMVFYYPDRLIEYDGL